MAEKTYRYGRDIGFFVWDLFVLGAVALVATKHLGGLGRLLVYGFLLIAFAASVVLRYSTRHRQPREFTIGDGYLKVSWADKEEIFSLESVVCGSATFSTLLSGRYIKVTSGACSFLVFDDLGDFEDFQRRCLPGARGNDLKGVK